MAKRKKASARKRRTAPEDETYLVRLGHVLRTPLGTLLVRAGGFALLLLLGGLVVRQARAQAHAVPSCRLTHASLRFHGLPRWVDAGLAARLQRPAGKGFSVSVFDPEAPARVRAAVLRHPMVKDVRSVRIRFPATAEVVPILRRPVARVALVVPDARGRTRRVTRLLADDESTHPEAPFAASIARRRDPLPEIVGIRAHGPVQWGVVWPDHTEQVAEAVEAAHVAERLAKAFGGRLYVSRIDVSRYPAAGSVRHHGEIAFRAVLRGIRGRRGRTIDIEWGRTDRKRTPGDHVEAGYDTKLARLRRALAKGPTSEPIEVRWPDDSGT